MELSVIIISYNTRDITRRCLTALFAELEGLEAEVFVVDNASTDRSPEMIGEEFPLVRVIVNEKNRGFGAANNQAIALTTAPAVLLLNSDAFVHPGSLRTMLTALASRPTTGAIAPKLLNVDGSLQPSVWPFPSPLRSWIEALGLSPLFKGTWHYRDWRRWSYDRQSRVPWAIGACLLLRKEALEATSGFDEAFFLYGEETDLEKRMGDKRWAVEFLPEARVTHLGGSSGSGQADAVFEEFSRAHERYIAKHHGRLGLWSVRLARVAGASIRVPSFWLLKHLRPSSRNREKFALWRRILVWNLGRRLGGLND